MKKAFRIGTIYLVTNTLTGMCYVGKALRGETKRWLVHQSEACKGDSETYFHRALRKYGAGAFVVMALYRCTEPLLNGAERHFIASLGTLSPNGYNLTKGGDGGGYGYRSDAERAAIGAKISAALTGKMSALGTAYYSTPEGDATKLRIAATLTGRKATEVECLNHTLGLLSRYSRYEERVKTRDSAYAHYASPAGALTKKRQSEAGLRRAATGAYFSVATRKVLSDKATAQWAAWRAAKAVDG
jgi:group I intron endonuclease